MNPSQWLVRTSDNLIAGPFSKDQVIQMIEEQRLSHQDEVCAGNSYWFFLHEEEEVEKHLGIDFPLPQSPSEHEEDETQTVTQADTPKKEKAMPDLEDFEPTDPEQKSLMRNRALRQFRPIPKRSAILQRRDAQQQHFYRPFTIGEIDRSSLWKALLLLLIAIALGLIWAIVELMMKKS